MEQLMHFTLIRPDATSDSMRTNLSVLEDLVRAARSRFAVLLRKLNELQGKPLARISAGRVDDRHPDRSAQGLARATQDMIAIIVAMDRMANELLLESRQSWASVGYVSGNVHKVAFGRWRLLGGRTWNDLSAVAVDERLRRMPRLAISLLEVVTILEEAVADLGMPAAAGALGKQ